MITVQDLVVMRNTRRVIDGVSLRVGSGEIHAICGPNGSGKSTLLSAIAGDLPYQSGQVLLAERDLKDLSDVQQAQLRAVLSQRPVLFPYTAKQMLDLVEKQRDALGLEMPLAQVDLSSLLEKRLTTMSGGEVARTMLAATLAQGAKTLLLDEPTAAFDRNFRDAFADWLVEWKALGYTILVVTHDEKIESLADSITSL